MTDQYRISPATEPKHDSRQGLLRPALWVLLIVSGAANAVSSTSGLNLLVGIGFGAVTLACVAALLVQHYRHRR